MKTNHTDEQYQAAIDAACNEQPFASLSLDKLGMTWEREKPLRSAILKSALDRLPEPPPPTADGKTPGQLSFEVTAGNGYTWNTCPLSVKEQWEKTASAVLAAFGGTGLEAAIARMEAVDWESWGVVGSSNAAVSGFRDEVIAAAREGQPASQPAETPWTEWHGGECPVDMTTVVELEYKMRSGQTDVISPPMYLDWSHYPDSPSFEVIAYRVTKWKPGFDHAVVDWKAKYEAQETTLNQVLETVASICARAEKAEAELANLRDWKVQQLQVESEWDCQMLAKKLGVSIGQSCRAGIQKAILAMLEQPQLSTLRPIAEEGEVSAGAVRVFASKLDGWKPKAYQITADTHFADILMPEAKAPAVEAAEPDKSYVVCTRLDCLEKITHYEGTCPECTAKPADTFTSHGKTWTRHTPGDPMPCDGESRVYILCDGSKSEKDWGAIRTAGVLNWSNEPTGDWQIIGWRHADEPTPAEPVKPWTPAVGDVVTLKSGGPKMTAVKAAPESCFWCNWFDVAERHEGCFPAATLQLA